ncbi:MAG: transpeptidase family protein [Candidatus Hydrogenedentes bacterium]|nr:transpeptidase family protein [Candidatus Hydrogenedentota bacterium]
MRVRSREAQEEAIARFGEPPAERQRTRIQLLLMAFLVVFTVIVLRLTQLHLNPRLELTEEEKMHFGEVILREPRGEIFDRNGLLLATNKEVPSLWVDPRAVYNTQELAMVLSGRLGLTEAEALSKLELTDAAGNMRKFVWVKRWITDLPESALEEIETVSYGAVQIQYEPVRFYPQGDTAAHLLGFVNRNGDASEGVERTFNPYLESIPGKKIARKDARRRILESQTYAYEAPQGGDMLQLTLDTATQLSLEQALDQRMIDCNAPRGMGIVLDPHTGAILALACRPAFDPNHYDQYDPEYRKNRALVDVFEPGSSFKIVTASGALEHGLVSPEEQIDCEMGSFNPYGHRIRDFHPHGVIPFAECFQESSNIAMIKVAARLGEERLESWIRRYGFGTPTSRDFPLESGGIFRAHEKWSRLSMGSLPMGQEISVTMMQLARAFAVIANGGYLIEPYFVERAVSRFGDTTYQHRPLPPTRILSEEVAATMQRLCHQVVEAGTGDYAAIPEYSVGGKTGTAQMVLPGGRGYDPDRFTTIFAGFAPVSGPRLVAVIIVQEPMIKLHYGGYVCGPLFSAVVREALIRMNVPPDQEVPEDEKAKQLREKEEQEKQADEAKVLLAQTNAAAHVLESGAATLEDADTVVERLTPEEMERSMTALLEPLEDVRLLSGAAGNGKKGELPDLSGLTKRAALTKLSELGVSWDAEGAGRVTAQDPPPGTPLRQVSLCALQFSAPSDTAIVAAALTPVGAVAGPKRSPEEPAEQPRLVETAGPPEEGDGDVVSTGLSDEQERAL